VVTYFLAVFKQSTDEMNELKDYISEKSESEKQLDKIIYVKTVKRVFLTRKPNVQSTKKVIKYGIVS